jgi:hypothetical protein
MLRGMLIKTSTRHAKPAGRETAGAKRPVGTICCSESLVTCTGFSVSAHGLPTAGHRGWFCVWRGLGLVSV